MIKTTEFDWPQKEFKSINCRKRDLIIRIANWLDDKDEPGYDVELYIGGIYDNKESKCIALSSGITEEEAKTSAILHAQKQISKLLPTILPRG